MSTLQEEFDLRRIDAGIPFLKWLKTLPEVEQDQWEVAASDERLSNTALIDIARARGASVSKEKMAVWRSENGFTRR